ncbi:MAG: FHIPEP family type III secretion protein, partial [Thermoleophilaceae bacterium]
PDATPRGAVDRAVAEHARAAQRGRGPTGPDPKELEDDAERLESEARSLVEQAEAAEVEARQRKQQIGRLLERLLPQEWLWREADEHDGAPVPGGERARVLDLTALEHGGLLWERELDEIHVRALRAWCSTPLATPYDAERVLRHILDRYWAADFAVLSEYRQRLLDRGAGGAEREVEDLRERLLEIIRGWLEGDPEFWKLTWLLEDPDTPPEHRMFTPDEASEQLREASERHEERVAEALRREREAGDPDSIHLWVGDRLDDLQQDRDGVLAVYRRAAGSRRPEIQGRLGARFAYHESWRESADAYRSAARQAPDDAARKRYFTGLARALFALDEHAHAIGELDLLAYGAVEDGHWRTSLVEELSRYVATHEAYAALAEWLEGAQATGRDETRRDAAAALVELAGRHYDRIIRTSEARTADRAGQLPPGATPLLLETDPAFFPAGEQTPELEPMLKEIEALREEIAAATGVLIPGVRIRVDPTLTDGRYVVLVSEGPVAEGHLDPADKGFPRPMVERLHRAVLDRLPDFAGLQEISRRLAEWERERPDADSVPRALREESSRTRLMQTIQALVRERVSIVDLAPIVAAFDGADQADGPQDVAERIRASLSQESLGLGESSTPIAVPPTLEEAVAAGVRRDDGKAFLALPSLEAEELLAAFRRLVAGRSDPVLVVRDPHLRPLARRLLEHEHPSLPVLARSELGPRGLRRVTVVQP